MLPARATRKLIVDTNVSKGRRESTAPKTRDRRLRDTDENAPIRKGRSVLYKFLRVDGGNGT